MSKRHPMPSAAALALASVFMACGPAPNGDGGLEGGRDAVVDAGPDDTLAGARDLGALADGTTTFTGTVGASDPEDYARFTVTRETEVRFALRKVSGNSALAVLHDDDGDGAIDPGEIDDETASQEGVDDEVHQILAPGEYFLRVRTAPQTTEQEVAEYAITLEALPVRRSERGSLAAAQDLGMLSTDGRLWGFVTNRAPAEYYRFTLLSPSDVTINLEGLSADADLHLVQDRNSNGAVEGDEVLLVSRGTSNASETLSISALPAGTYAIEVAQYAGETSYRLRIAATPSSPTTTPTRLRPDEVGAVLANPRVETNPTFTTTGESVAPNAPERYYAVVLPEPGILTADLQSVTGDLDVQIGVDRNGNGYLDPAARDTNGDLVVTRDETEVLAYAPERGRRDESARAFLPEGRYIIRVVGANKASANYSLRVGFYGTPTDSAQFRVALALTPAARMLLSSVSAGPNRTYEDLAGAVAGAIERVIARGAFDRREPNTLDVSVTVRDLGRNTLASASPGNFTRGRVGRPLPTAGSIEINSNPEIFALLRAHPRYFVDTFTHALLRAMGAGAWRERDGTLDLVRARTDLVRGAYLTTAMVPGTMPFTTYASAAYGDLLRTWEPTEVPVTDDVGAASDYSHWRVQVLRDEASTHAASPAGPPGEISVLTLAALRDLGWDVNYGAAGAYVLPRYRPTLAPLHRESALARP